MSQGRYNRPADAAVIEALGGLVDGDLAVAESDSLSAHVVACDACRDRVHEAALVAAAVREAASAYVPRADIEAAFLEAVNARIDSAARAISFASVSLSGKGFLPLRTRQ